MYHILFRMTSYLVSLCSVCLRSALQYLDNTNRSLIFFLFLKLW